MDAKKTTSLGATLAWAEPELCIWCKTATYSRRAFKTEAVDKILSFKNKMDYSYSHEVSQLAIYNMDLILSLKLVRDDALRIGVGIELKVFEGVINYLDL